MEKSGQSVKPGDKTSEQKDCAKKLEPCRTECLSDIQTSETLPFCLMFIQ